MLKMFKKNGFSSTVICIAILFMLVSSSVFAAEQIILKMGHEQNQLGGTQIVAETLKELLEFKTNGELTIEIYPQGSLSSSPEELLEFLRNGIVDLSISSAGNISGFCNDLQFLDMPFMLKSHEHIQVFAQSTVIQEIFDIFEDQVGVKVVDIAETGNGNCITSNKPIKSFKDMQGLKIRCMMNPTFIDIYKSFGAVPTPIDWGELFTALELGTVDAQDNQPYVNWVMGLMEVQNCTAWLRQYWSGGIFLISNETLKKLTPEQQEILIESIHEACALERQWIHRKDLETLELLKEKEGYTVTYPERAPFIEAAQVVHDKWFEEYPHWKNWFERVQMLNPDTREPKAAQ